MQRRRGSGGGGWMCWSKSYGIVLVFLLFVLSSFVSAGLPLPFSFPPPCSVACGSFYCRGCPLSLSQNLASCSSSCCNLMCCPQLIFTYKSSFYSYLPKTPPCKSPYSPFHPWPLPTICEQCTPIYGTIKKELGEISHWTFQRVTSTFKLAGLSVAPGMASKLPKGNFHYTKEQRIISSLKVSLSFKQHSQLLLAFQPKRCELKTWRKSQICRFHLWWW